VAIERIAYRPWKGGFRGPLMRFWPIARLGIGLILKRKLFWLFLVISLFSFLFNSAIIYLIAQIQGQTGIRLPRDMRNLQTEFLFTGTGKAYREFISFQSTVVMIFLAFAGGILVGNDFRRGAIPFYLSRPIGKIEYFLGKFLATAILTTFITLVPAVVLFIEYGAFTESFAYYTENLRILGAIVVYGALVSLVPAVLLLGVASLLQRTIAIVFAWVGLFVFVPAAVNIVRTICNRRGLGDYWVLGLADIWANLRWISGVLFGIREEEYAESWPLAALALAAACLIAIAVFWRRVSAVEVVR